MNQLLSITYAIFCNFCYCFVIMKLIFFLNSRYDLPAICDCSQECVKALLGEECTPIKEEEMQRKPCQIAIDVLQKTIAVQGTFLHFFV